MKDLDYYKGLNYSVVLKKVGRRYYVAIPELHCHATDDNLEAALASLNQRKEEVFTSLIEIGCGHRIAEPGQLPRGVSEVHWRQVKIAIVLAVLFFALGSYKVARKVIDFKAHVAESFYTSRYKYSLSGVLLRELNLFATIPPAEREELRRKAKEAVPMAQPILSEAKHAFDEPKQVPSRGGF